MSTKMPYRNLQDCFQHATAVYDGACDRKCCTCLLQNIFRQAYSESSWMLLITFAMFFFFSIIMSTQASIMILNLQFLSSLSVSIMFAFFGLDLNTRNSCQKPSFSSSSHINESFISRAQYPFCFSTSTVTLAPV